MKLHVAHKELIGCFRKPRRKHGIRGNQSTATVPVLKRPPRSICSFAVIGRERLCVCPAQCAGARAANKSADWLITRSVLSLHPTLIWPSSGLSFLRSCLRKQPNDSMKTGIKNCEKADVEEEGLGLGLGVWVVRGVLFLRSRQFGVNSTNTGGILCRVLFLLSKACV